MNKAQEYFGAETGDFDLYARPIPKCGQWRVNWGSMSIFHQHSHSTLKYCSHVIDESGHKLGSLRWEIGASLIPYRISKSSKLL